MEQDITSLLGAWRGGDIQSRDRLVEAVYSTLRQIAAARLAGAPDSVTLRPTVLVHEAVLRMLQQRTDYADRVHFFALVSLKMRDVLVDSARARSSIKRGGGQSDVTLSWVDWGVSADGATAEHEVLALHQALLRLGENDQRAANAIVLTYFGGMKREEVALALDVSQATLDRDLRFARAWLSRELA